MRLNNNGSREVVKEILDIIMVNEDKNVKWICGLKKKLIIFTYCFKLVFILNYIIKLFYQTYLIYSMI